MSYDHYFKKVPSGAAKIDVYRVLAMFEVIDPCVQHAVKKLLVAGGRGAKNAQKDIEEAIVSLRRWQAMRLEEVAAPAPDPAEGPFDFLTAKNRIFDLLTRGDSDAIYSAALFLEKTSPQLHQRLLEAKNKAAKEIKNAR